jgi:hypothetical protein
MSIDLSKLDFTFAHKPLLVGGKAMEYYGLRKSGQDIDFILAAEDHKRLVVQYPNHIKDIHGDIGVCEFEFELWNQICMFGYDYLKEGAIEEPDFLVVSLERLLFLKALAMHIPKYHADLELVVGLVLKKAYGKGM